MGAHRFAPIPALLGDTGWRPCFIRRISQSIKYWNRLVKMSESRVTKLVFEYDYVTRVGKCWNSNMLEIFKLLDMEDIFHQKLECSDEYLRKK